MTNLLNTPRQYYIAQAYFPTISVPGWGMITEGFCSHDAAHDAVVDADADQAINVIYVDLDAGTVTDVTAQFEAYREQEEAA